MASLVAKDIAKSMVALTKERPDQIDSIIDETIRLLQSSNLLASSAQILRYLEYHQASETRHETLYITATNEPSPELVNYIKTALNADPDAPVTVTIDPALAGGATATYRGLVLDASTDTIINRLARDLVA